MARRHVVTAGAFLLTAFSGSGALVVNFSLMQRSNYPLGELQAVSDIPLPDQEAPAGAASPKSKQVRVTSLSSTTTALAPGPPADASRVVPPNGEPFSTPSASKAPSAFAESQAGTSFLPVDVLSDLGEPGASTGSWPEVSTGPAEAARPTVTSVEAKESSEELQRSSTDDRASVDHTSVDVAPSPVPTEQGHKSDDATKARSGSTTSQPRGEVESEDRSRSDTSSRDDERERSGERSGETETQNENKAEEQDRAKN